MNAASLVRITGALAEVRPLGDASLYEQVRVGARRLLGEVIRVEHDTATIQIFEETSGLALGEPVVRTGTALTAELGPGLLGGAFDGIGRPLDRLAEAGTDVIAVGAEAATLDRSASWHFVPRVGLGDEVEAGDVIGVVTERNSIEHAIMVPPDRSGVVSRIQAGDFTVDDAVCGLQDGTSLTLAQRWPVRLPRPFSRRLPSSQPFITGQRVFDFLFPVAEGGSVAVPGGFGTGKTVIEQSLAKYAEADVVVYIACGERGNEMADVIDEFQHLVDPDTGRPVMDRTVLVVNTSNMPVAAREASVYFGITVAEYFRDMGLRVAVMADSLSRWAEALREIGGRLQEMPGEEGYPTYLGSRLSKIYERAGAVTPLGRPDRTGAVTFISAISPPGGDFSEPVTQASLRVAGALWALDAGLAHRRQFPAVEWETSYSLYGDAVAEWYRTNAGDDWPGLQRDVLRLLERDREVREIAGLIGPEALEDSDRVLLETAQLIRDALLGQSAFDAADAFSPIPKTHQLAALVMAMHEAATAAVERGTPFAELDLDRITDAVRNVQRANPTALAGRVEAVHEAIAALGPVSQTRTDAHQHERRPDARRSHL
jgi:V/A-type H+/Na+-transporting ATPase subunit A